MSEPQLVYHYTKREIALERILPTQTLMMAPLGETNDPLETGSWIFPTEGESGSGFYESATRAHRWFAEARECSKLFATTVDREGDQSDLRDLARGFARPRMWSQYADNHTGVCLAFDRCRLGMAIKSGLSDSERVFEGKVEYADSILDLPAFRLDQHADAKRGMHDYLADNSRLLFFSKRRDWEAESEWRWVLMGADNKARFLQADSSLREIIVGYRFPIDAYRSLLREYRDRFGIGLYRLTWLQGTPHRTELTL